MMTCMGLVLLLCASCSPTRFISEDEFMLSSVGLSSTNKHVKSSDYRSYVAQEANSKWFNLLKVPLGMYCMSGTDSTKRFNKFMHRIGEAPVVYDTTYVVQTKKSLSLALQNKGYLHAKVEADVLRKNRKKKPPRRPRRRAPRRRKKRSSARSANKIHSSSVDISSGLFYTYTNYGGGE